MSKLVSKVSEIANNNQLTMFSEVVARARVAFATNRTKDVSFRKAQLRGVLRLFDENEALLCDALRKDLRKCRFEAIAHEIEFTRNDIRSLLQGIDSWVKPEKAEKSIVTLFDSVYVHHEPYGVCLVIGAWNYPVQLVLSPLVGAICAGNACVVKPSEISPHTAQAIAELLPRYIDRDLYPVILGGVEETTQLLREKFDYVFFTGSPQVGRLINKAVAGNLTPVTLELGGKSPVFVDESITNVDVVLRRLLWGKFINAGQTCIAPDYVMCTKEVQERLVNSLERILREYFGEDPKTSQDFPRIVSARHWQRLTKLLGATNGTVVAGGKFDEAEKYISPTVVTNVTADDALMQDELFGPILPIMPVSNIDEAIDYVNRNEKPLSLYIFTNKNSVVKRWRDETSSGALLANDTVLHIAVDALPFGGVGNSGMGKYHGHYSFETFSHKKSVMHKDFNPIGEFLAGNRYPPYSNTKLAILGQLTKKRNLFLSYIPPVTIFLLGFASAFILSTFF